MSEPNMFSSQTSYAEMPGYFSRVCWMDAAIRCAASENSTAEEFGSSIDKAYGINEQLYAEHTLCLMLLLVKSGKKEWIRILQEKLSVRENSYQPFRSFAVPITEEEMIKAMDFISDDFVEESYADKNPFIGMTPDYINTPLYHAMITGNTDYAGRYIEMKLKKFSDLTEYMLSAIFFRDTDFLRTTFRKGVEFNIGIISAFCTDHKTVAYLCDNFSEYLFPDKAPGDDPRNNIHDFIRMTVSEKEMLLFAEQLFDKLGYERFTDIADNIPKIRVMTSYAAEHIYTSPVFFTENYFSMENSFKNVLKYILDDNIIFLADNISRDVTFSIDTLLKEAGAEVNISYDLHDCDGSCFRGQNLRTVRKFLKENSISFDLNGFTEMLASLLDYNDENITRSVINFLLINESNISDVIEYLTENNLYRALNAVNKFYITPVIL